MRPLLAFWGGVALIALPLLVAAVRQPSEFMARLNADGTFQSGWLDFMSGNLPVTNVPAPVTSLRPGSNSAVIAVPSRADELRAWAAERTDGNLHQEYDCDNLMLLAYRIPAYGATSSSGP